MAKVGIEGKLYVNDGTYDVPVWLEVELARDVTLGLEATAADANSRRTRWKQNLMAMLDAGIDWDMLYDSADPAWVALMTAFFALIPIELAVMDGSIVSQGSQGLRILVGLTKFERGEPLENAMTTSVNTKPHYVDDITQTPSWYTVP